MEAICFYRGGKPRALPFRVTGFRRRLGENKYLVGHGVENNQLKVVGFRT
jgi:hypothetical protein